ncbi:NfeD family protein [Pyrococcus abyssi]|uniref:Membrane protein n=1 Tax=Pyrococcus abyssi (strain GE5 / Orsay) TaxID=272844 RepID=Q9V188_PYRAB|nr:NfeD family protein [Pyrococcus abyssi]CAB49462.1 Membrane protein [Pyrococcus abyssi GE5]CCE69929.1 TPA: hypothetical protein PAB0371 [Pyrococcus abyssi GE5]
MLNFLKILAILSDEIAVLVFFLLILPELGFNIPLKLVLILVSILVLKDALLIKLFLDVLKKKPEVGIEGLIGERGIVVEDLTPEGMIKVRGELWRARAISGSIKKREAVKVIRVEGNIMIVERW